MAFESAKISVLTGFMNKALTVAFHFVISYLRPRYLLNCKQSSINSTHWSNSLNSFEQVLIIFFKHPVQHFRYLPAQISETDRVNSA
jgi:hypothetical protein